MTHQNRKIGIQICKLVHGKSVKNLATEYHQLSIALQTGSGTTWLIIRSMILCGKVCSFLDEEEFQSRFNYQEI